MPSFSDILLESLAILDERARWKVELERHKAAGTESGKKVAAAIEKHQDARYAHDASGKVKHLKPEEDKAPSSRWAHHPAFRSLVAKNQATRAKERVPGEDDDEPTSAPGAKMAKPSGKKELGHSVRTFMKRRKEKIAQIRGDVKGLTKSGPTKAAAAKTDKEQAAAMPDRETPRAKVAKDLAKKAASRKSMIKKYGTVPKHDPESPEGKMETHLHTASQHLAKSVAARKKYEQATSPYEAMQHKAEVKAHALAHKDAAAAAYAHAAKHGLDSSEHLRKKLDKHMMVSHGHSSDTHLKAMRSFARGLRKSNPVKGAIVGQLKASKPTDWRGHALAHHASNEAAAAAKKTSDEGKKHLDRMMPPAQPSP